MKIPSAAVSAHTANPVSALANPASASGENSRNIAVCKASMETSASARLMLRIARTVSSSLLRARKMLMTDMTIL